MDLVDYVDRIWDGRLSVEEYHTGNPREEENAARLHADGLSELAEGVAFWPARSNVVAFKTGEGLALVDSGEKWSWPLFWEHLRRWSGGPVETVVLTHGHPDHTGGLWGLDAEAERAGLPKPHVIAHEAVPRRFEKYERSFEYNAIVNRRQFQDPTITWPREYRYPDETYCDQFELRRGELVFELHHGRGETDDATWVFLPSQKMLCCGDFFMWVAPNAGNPQKSQRYVGDWAKALRQMMVLAPEILLPGHGFPIFGRDRVETALGDTASYLESLEQQTLKLMNEGASLDEVLASVRAPEDLLTRPYLRPLFDDSEFVVRNVWRYYGGWYDGNPSRLKPARDSAVARELCALAGGPGVLSERALELDEKGDLKLATHLAYLAVLASPDDPFAVESCSIILAKRAEQERSSMARAIFSEASVRVRNPPG
ncbi:MAG: MBL fold metallo-hydrolase [Actinomycetota bacterium]|jgi:alkyl sulfatase BDS1-like metallo-beta-lactamase superfamily hydrolase|nr:MBL fold metallo-hydrolase [Actinomycetota bacterium]